MLDVDDFRRYDIALGEALRLSVHCTGTYSSPNDSVGDIQCQTPVRPGTADAARQYCGLGWRRRMTSAFRQNKFRSTGSSRWHVIPRKICRKISRRRAQRMASSPCARPRVAPLCGPEAAALRTLRCNQRYSNRISNLGRWSSVFPKTSDETRRRQHSCESHQAAAVK